MGNYEILLLVISLITISSALGMLFFKNPISVSLCLLSVLISTAGIYGLIGEHVIATLQLIIYAGAIMVLFIFTIMLLNIDREVKAKAKHWTKSSMIIYPMSIMLFILIAYNLNHFIKSPAANYQFGLWNKNYIENMGGQTWSLSMEVFNNNFVTFELVGITLLLAAVGAVVLAKRKI